MKQFVKILAWFVSGYVTVAFILLILIALTSCKSTKTTTTETKIDTVLVHKESVIVKRVTDTIRFKDPCDEDGNLRPILIDSSSEGVKTTIKSDNGDLLITKEQKADTVYVNRDVYKTQYRDRDVEKIVTKTRVPKWAWFSLIINIVMLAWIFRKRIGIPI